MTKIMTLINRMITYFFSPEDSSGLAAQGTFALAQGAVGMGSVKALFWVLMTMGGFYLITLI